MSIPFRTPASFQSRPRMPPPSPNQFICPALAILVIFPSISSTERIIFLDIDGVLNNEGWSERNGVLSCDPDNVAFLNFILAETGAEVVVSSDWRKWMSWEELCDRLTGAGVEGVIRDRTPVMDLDTPPGTNSHRGGEVDAWLAATGYVGRFVILDDRSDLEPHLGVLVKTNQLRGLSVEEAIRAVELLGAREKSDPFSGIDDAEL